jgi:hypothetical protein
MDQKGRCQKIGAQKTPWLGERAYACAGRPTARQNQKSITLPLVIMLRGTADRPDKVDNVLLGPTQSPIPNQNLAKACTNYGL